MVKWLELLGLQKPDEYAQFPLSADTPELRALLAGVLNIGSNGLAAVDEGKALGIPAFSRGVDLIGGTIAGLPLKTYREQGSSREVVPSIFDNPAGAFGMTPFVFIELVVRHLVCYQEAFLQHVTNGAGAVVGYYPITPSAVQKVEYLPEGWGRRFTVHYQDGPRVYGDPMNPGPAGVITHILGPTMDGLRGAALWDTHKALFQIAIAAEQAAARTFTGALVRGLVTTAQDEDVDELEAKAIQESINARVGGVDKAGQMVFVNRHLTFAPWQQTNADAQYQESRSFQIEEFARLLGMPPHLLAAVDKATSWGTGIAEQNLGLARYTLMSYTSRIESALRPLNPPGTWQEFDYKGLLQGSPADEINLLLAQVAGGILTADEARAILNLGPLGDSPRAPEQGADR